MTSNSISVNPRIDLRMTGSWSEEAGSLVLDLTVIDIDANAYDPDDASWASWDLYLTWSTML